MKSFTGLELREFRKRNPHGYARLARFVGSPTLEIWDVLFAMRDQSREPSGWVDLQW